MLFLDVDLYQVAAETNLREALFLHKLIRQQQNHDIRNKDGVDTVKHV